MEKRQETFNAQLNPQDKGRFTKLLKQAMSSIECMGGRQQQQGDHQAFTQPLQHYIDQFVASVAVDEEGMLSKEAMLQAIAQRQEVNLPFVANAEPGSLDRFQGAQPFVLEAAKSLLTQGYETSERLWSERLSTRQTEQVVRTVQEQTHGKAGDAMQAHFSPSVMVSDACGQGKAAASPRHDLPDLY